MEDLVEQLESPLGKVELAATTLYVSDFDAALAWYEEVLGLQPAMSGEEGDRYAAFTMGGGLVVLEPITAAVEVAGPGNESTTVNLIVDREPSLVRDDLLARGVACGEILQSPNYTSFLMRDRDGNRFYVSRPSSPQARADVTAASTPGSDS